MSKKLVILFLFLIFSTEANAYLGPGMGTGIIAATVGIIVALLVAIFGIIWFPIKRFLKKKILKIKNKPRKKKIKFDFIFSNFYTIYFFLRVYSINQTNKKI